MAKISMDKFDSNVEDFGSYIERLEHFFTATEITEHKASHLITCIDPATYRLLKAQVAPAKVTDKTYEQLVDILKEHFCGKPLQIAERFKFYQRKQKPNESVSDFSAALRQLSVTCNFGNFLEDILCDMFVLGLSNKATQRKLLATKDLTFKTALDTANADEIAQRESQVVANASGSYSKNESSSVHFTGAKSNYKKGHYGPKSKAKKQTGDGDTKCYRCNKGGHNPHKCRFKDATCFKCSKRGHIAPACNSESHKDSQSSAPSHGQANYVSNAQIANDNSINSVSSNDNASSCADSVSSHASHTPSQQEEVNKEPIGLFHVGSGKSKPDVKPIWVTVNVNDKPVSLQLDSGSAYTIIPRDMFNELPGNGNKLKPTKVILETYGQELLPLLGECEV
ncbi:uncharacterized protein [Amphiura filiformis]|uniref:uncharacterized protein n=1 Tax=Amphiura filiformis TaxID=82378 RepID=UPI003B225731